MKMSTYLHSFAFAAAVLVSTAAYSSVLYVDSLADESADGDGASPETALAALDAALNPGNPVKTDPRTRHRFLENNS